MKTRVVALLLITFVLGIVAGKTFPGAPPGPPRTERVANHASAAPSRTAGGPAELPDGLTLAAIPRRADPRDAFLSNGPMLDELPPGARVATGSPRRAWQSSITAPTYSVGVITEARM